MPRGAMAKHGSKAKAKAQAKAKAKDMGKDKCWLGAGTVAVGL